MKARGVRFGRKPKLTPHQVQEALARREAGEALVEIGRSYNVIQCGLSGQHGFQPREHFGPPGLHALKGLTAHRRIEVKAFVRKLETRP